MGKHTAVSMLEMKQIYANADARIKYDPPLTREYVYIIIYFFNFFRLRIYSPIFPLLKMEKSLFTMYKR